MLTGKRVTERDMMLGLKAGADDFLLKPCAPAELQTRLQAGERAVERQNAALQSLASRTTAEAQPHGGTVLCRYCSRIQLEDGSWMDRLVASSIATESRLVAGICDDCVGKQLAQIPVDSL